jgi:hypothetical protein
MEGLSKTMKILSQYIQDDLAKILATRISSMFIERHPCTTKFGADFLE